MSFIMIIRNSFIHFINISHHLIYTTSLIISKLFVISCLIFIIIICIISCAHSPLSTLSVLLLSPPFFHQLSFRFMTIISIIKHQFCHHNHHHEIHLHQLYYPLIIRHFTDIVSSIINFTLPSTGVRTDNIHHLQPLTSNYLSVDIWLFGKTCSWSTFQIFHQSKYN